MKGAHCTIDVLSPEREIFVGTTGYVSRWQTEQEKEQQTDFNIFVCVLFLSSVLSQTWSAWIYTTFLIDAACSSRAELVPGFISISFQCSQNVCSLYQLSWFLMRQIIKMNLWSASLRIKGPTAPWSVYW